MKKFICFVLAFLFGTFLPADAVEFGIDATGDPNAVHIQGNTSGFLYSERIILTAAHVLDQLKIQPNGDTEGFVYAPGISDQTTAKRYKIIKAFIPKTYVNADHANHIQPVDDFAIIVINEDMPLKVRSEIATEEQMFKFANSRANVQMVGYGLQSGSQRNNPQEMNRAPKKMSAYLLSPQMMIEHYNQHQLRPPSWKRVDWGTNSNRETGTPCNGDSGSGLFVEESNTRYYVGTTGNGLGTSNCKSDGTYSLGSGGEVSWFTAPFNFLYLLKTAESFVADQKEKEISKVKEAQIAAELKAKQEAEAKAAAELKAEEELKAKQEAEAKAAALKAQQEAEAKAAADLKAKQEAEAKAAALKKTTITCLKGKLVKKVTAVKPVCPKGYKKK